MTEKKSFWRENRLYIIIWAAAEVFSVLHLLPPFNADIISYDSSYQYFLTRNSLAEIWRLIPTDFSPPLYALVLKLWTMLFGDTLAVMRSFALVPLCGMYFLAAFPIRRAFGGKASVMCTVFFALSSVNFIIVSEIRPVTLAYFFVTAAAIYSYIALFFDNRYAYICFTVFSVLAMYTHNVGMLAALAFYVCAFLTAVVQKKRRHAVKFLISGVISAVCYIPWLFMVVQQFGNVQKHYWKESSISLPKIYDWTIGVNFDDGGSQLLGKVIIPVAAMIAIVSFLCVRGNRDKLKSIKSLSGLRELAAGKFKEPVAKTVYVILLYAAPIAALLLFTLLVYPIIAMRYFYIFCGTGMMMIAAGFSQCSGKIGIAVLSVLTAVCFALHAVNIGKEFENGNFSEMIDYIRSTAPESEIAFIHEHEWTLGTVMYYFPEAKHYIVDETWTVLTTFDALPGEVINIGDCKAISEYEKNFFLFLNFAPDTLISLYDEYEEDENFSVEDKGLFSTYQQKWRLIYVTVKD